MEISLKVGEVYPFNQTTMRVLCVKGNQVILENWADDKIIKYTVATGPYLYEERLAWLNGGHFPCKESMPMQDTPFEALQKAFRYMNGESLVHALIADTHYGPKVSLYSNRELAMKALQHALDHNASIQSLAENRGIKPLTAEAYLQGVLSDVTYPIDEYIIRTRVVNESIVEMEE